MKRWGTLALIVVVLVVVVGGIKAWSIHSMIEGFKAQGIQKEAVSTYKVSYQQWRPTVNVIGSLRAVKGADLSPELAGIVDEIRTEERRVGKECVSQCRYRWQPYHEKKKKK